MIRYFFKVAAYQISKEKKTLDMYMRAIRRLDKLSETEWACFRDLVQYEKQIYKK